MTKRRKPTPERGNPSCPPGGDISRDQNLFTIVRIAVVRNGVREQFEFASDRTDGRASAETRTVGDRAKIGYAIRNCWRRVPHTAVVIRKLPAPQLGPRFRSESTPISRFLRDKHNRILNSQRRHNYLTAQFAPPAQMARPEISRDELSTRSSVDNCVCMDDGRRHDGTSRICYPYASTCSEAVGTHAAGARTIPPHCDCFRNRRLQFDRQLLDLDESSSGPSCAKSPFRSDSPVRRELRSREPQPTRYVRRVMPSRGSSNADIHVPIPLTPKPNFQKRSPSWRASLSILNPPCGVALTACPEAVVLSSIAVRLRGTTRAIASLSLAHNGSPAVPSLDSC